MALDKSETHLRVMKDGKEAWISKSVWESDKDHNGFVEIANEPVEAIELRQKLKAKNEPVQENLAGIEIKSLKKQNNEAEK